MIPHVRFRAEAEAELDDAVAWYEAQMQGLGAEFLRALEAIIALIWRNPDLFPLTFRSARRATLRRFPYSLIYTVTVAEIHRRVHTRTPESTDLAAKALMWRR
jgi:hypothetical protein